MKATSKLISVVLILALCLSIFTISASAAVYDQKDENGNVIAVFDSGEETEDIEVEGIPLQNTSGGAPEVTKVGPNETVTKLTDALKENAVIELTGSVTINGSLSLPAGVKINLGGNTLTINGSAAAETAAMIASGAKFSNGSLAITGAAKDTEGKLISGFESAANGTVILDGVALTLDDATALGGVLFVEGSCNQDIAGHIATGSVLPDGSDPAESNEPVYAVLATAPVNTGSGEADKKDENVIDPDKKDENVVDPDKKDENVVDPDKKDENVVDPDKKDENVVDPDKKDENVVDPDKKDENVVDPDKKDEDVVDPDKKDEDVVDPDKKDENVDEEKKDENSDNKEQDASFNNEDPVTVEKPEEKVLEEEVRVDPKAQEEAENAAKTLTATDEVSGALVTVRGINLPEDVTLVVKHLDNTSIGGLAEDERAILALDISLVLPDGTEYEPKDDPNVKAVSVTITHPALKELFDEETLVLYHIGEEGAEKVNSADAAEGSDTMNFSAGSFSPFVIVASTGLGRAKTGSDGEVHRKTVTIKNVTGETYIKNKGDLVFEIYGGAAPESVSIIDPDNVSGGNLAVYQQGYLILDDGTAPRLYDYDLGTNFDMTTGKIKDPTKPVVVTIYKEALVDAPNGKWAVVFWFKDTANSGDSTRVYMVQYVNIAPQLEIKGVGYNYDEDTKTFEAEKCDYDSIQVLLTADLESFTLSGDGRLYAAYDRNVSTKKMMVRIDGKERTVNASEYFEVSDYYATDPLGHEYIAGKSLKIHDSLLKQLPYNVTYQLDVSQSNKKAPVNAASDTFWVHLTPGIAVADGLTDYIKGRNTWIKFVACAPIDYDDDGTLAIWIGGQKISHDYYSISNDHCTLWIYRNLLDQLKSNNSYTLTARLWEWRNTPNGKVKDTWYPATASFNILAAGSTSYRSPKTGDESNVALWAAVLVLSGGAVVALVPKKKKSK